LKDAIDMHEDVELDNNYTVRLKKEKTKMKAWVIAVEEYPGYYVNMV